MKLSRMLLAAAMVFALAGCDQKPKSTTEQIKDKVNDVLDRRPNATGSRRRRKTSGRRPSTRASSA
jgi:type IV pilus biogenesis protein CpaD/CtpE